MKSAEELLDFNFSAPAYAACGYTVLTKQHQKVIDKAIEANSNVSLRCNNADVKAPNLVLLDSVVKKFKANYHKSNVEELFSIRELRLLTYAVQNIGDGDVIKVLMKTLRNRWKNSYVNGLVFSALNGWLSFEPITRQYIYSVLQHSLKTYTGTRRKMLLIKRHLKYLTSDGAQVLAHDIQSNSYNSDFLAALKRSTNYFGLKEDRLNLSYYSDVICELYSDGPITNKYDEVQQVLVLHNNQRTDKIIIPKMVMEVKYRSGAIVENVKDLAIKRIGAPEIDSLWRLTDGTFEQRMTIVNAQKILHKWVIERFTTIFFDRIYEPQRKAFWLSHLDIIEDIRIYAPYSVRYRLKNDPRISEQLFDVIVKRINKDTSSNECVLVFYIGNYYITEFSNTGSIYAYRKDKAGLNMMKDSIYDVGDLKKSWLPSLAPVDGGYVYHYYEEGRMVHVGYWQNRMNNWLQRYI